jgi:multiple sugar transport system substrate-binding protein
VEIVMRLRSLLLTATMVAAWALPAAAETTLKALFMAQAAYSEADVRAMTEAFTKANPDVKVDLEFVPYEGLHDKTVLAQGSGGGYDVVLFDVIWPAEYATNKVLVDVSDKITDEMKQGVLPGAWTTVEYEGKRYGMPWILDTKYLFYNKDILAKAGVTPPKTWDELKTAAKKLTVGKQYGIAFSAPANYEGTWQFLPFMWSNGGDEKNIATQQTADALQLWVDLVKDGSASKSVVNWTQADVNDQFRAGNAAMMINGPWQFPVLNADKNLHYEVVPTPAPKAGATVVSPLGGETWTVPQTGDKARQQVAAKIVQCLNSDENQLLLAKQRQTVPTKESLQGQFVTQNPSMKAFSDIVRTARARTGELGADWPKAATKIYTGIQSALTGGAAPLAALQQAQNG